MSHRRMWGVLLAGLCLVAMEGCSHCCRRPFCATCPRSCSPCAPGPGRGPLPQQPLTLPSAPVPLPPGSETAPPMPPAPPALQAPPAPADIRGYGPSPATPQEYRWHAPGQNGERRPLPEFAPPRESVHLRNPEPVEAPAPPKPAPATPPLPVGIAQFSQARDQVYSGLKPADPEGFEWLKANGYRAVLHLRAPADANTAHQKVAEKYGIRYVSLDVTAQNLSQALAEFNRMVTERANQPLFVYDKDGMLAGALWYLHFLTVDRASDDVARQKATLLGLKENTTEENRTLWVAIQKIIAQMGR